MGFVDDLKEAVGLGDEWQEPDSWKGRIGEAAYTPPSGLRITFDFEDLTRRTIKKTSVWSFPDVDGELVQDQGVGGRRFPMRVIFWGVDCDLQANVFEAALDERGYGRLEHPLYGEHVVVPGGEYARNDALKTAANQVIFEVEFFKTIDTVYPSEQDDPASAVLTALDAFGSAAEAEFATQLDQGSIAEQKGVLDRINDAIDAVGDQLDKVAAVQNVVNSAFQDYVDTLQNAVDTFVKDPLTLAFNTRQMIQAPARAMASIAARLDGYSNLAQDIFTTPVSLPGGPGGLGPRIDSATGTGNDAQGPNTFHVRNLVASSAVSGAVLTTLYTTNTSGAALTVPDVGRKKYDAQKNGVSTGGSAFATASETLDTAESLLNLVDSLTEWRDENYESISGGNLTASEIENFLSAPSNTDLADAHNQLRQAVALAAGYLIQLSFTLKRAKRRVLDRARAIPELVYELYASVDDTDINFFIESNDLSGDEILELPAGREIVYYV